MRTRALGQIILGLVLVAVLVFVLANRDRGDSLQSNTTIATTGTPSTAAPSTEATTTTSQAAATVESTTTTDTPTVTEATTATTGATTSTTAAVTTTTAAPTIDPEYAEGLAEARRVLADLAEKMAATNQAFNDRYSTGPDFRMTADAFSAVIAGARTLAEQVSGLEVPTPLVHLHEATGGPVARAARLAPFAEEVLAGLRLPYPEDGTARRSAVAGYNTATEEFAVSVNDLAQRVRDSADSLGVNSTAPDSDGLSEEATLYLERLSGLVGTATRLRDDLNDANEAWEGQRAAQATYRQTEAALLEIVDGSRSLESAVRDLSAPDDLAGLHDGPDGPVDLAGRLVTLAEEVVAGLRLPSPDDGSTRRSAAAGYAAAADQFDAVAEQLIGQSS